MDGNTKIRAPDGAADRRPYQTRDATRQLRAIPEKFATRDDGGKHFIEGYFAVYNSDYVICDGMSESIAPGAFAGSLSGDVRMLTNHDAARVIARTKSGTMTMRDDARGLWCSGEVNDGDSEAVNTHARVARGDVDNASIGFRIIREEYSEREDGSVHWTIMEAELYEVSVCTFPAYEETNVIARCRDRDAVREREAAKLVERKADLLRRLNHGQ